jgi:hypothetical protein
VPGFFFSEHFGFLHQFKIVNSLGGYYSLGDGNMCCQGQGNVCSVLVFSSSNDGAFPLGILYPISTYFNILI